MSPPLAYTHPGLSPMVFTGKAGAFIVLLTGAAALREVWPATKAGCARGDADAPAVEDAQEDVISSGKRPGASFVNLEAEMDTEDADAVACAKCLRCRACRSLRSCSRANSLRTAAVTDG